MVSSRGMSTQEILAELPRLSIEERERIAKALRDLEEKERLNSSSAGQEPRIANLHPGAMVMAPDFDDPLPDDFWFGKES